MTLAELNPKITDNGFLVFDCPNPACVHRIRVPIDPAVDGRGQSWRQYGAFPHTITLQPSIDAGCWHGHISNGEITP